MSVVNFHTEKQPLEQIKMMNETWMKCKNNIHILLVWMCLDPQYLRCMNPNCTSTLKLNLKLIFKKVSSAWNVAISCPEAVLVNVQVHSQPYCTHELSSGKRAPFLCGVEINRIRDLGDLGGIIRLCIGERQQRWWSNGNAVIQSSEISG